MFFLISLPTPLRFRHGRRSVPFANPNSSLCLLSFWIRKYFWMIWIPEIDFKSCSSDFPTPFYLRLQRSLFVVFVVTWRANIRPDHEEEARYSFPSCKLFSLILFLTFFFVFGWSPMIELSDLRSVAPFWPNLFSGLFLLGLIAFKFY